ncbi:MAG: tetratricopeptide repeat protein [Candidatus Hermodarchaeota archaeon]
MITQQIFVLGKMARFDEAREVITEGDAILASLTANERETGAYWIAFFEHRKGDYYYIKKDYDTALEYWHRALALREKIGNHYAIEHSLFNIGLLYRLKGELDTALDYYQRALDITKQMGNFHLTATTFRHIGMIYSNKGDLDTALTYYQQALNTYEEIGSSSGIAGALGSMAYFYILKGELNTALEYTRRHLSLAKKIKNPMNLAGCFGFFAWIYYLKGELDTALDYVQQTLAFQEQIGEFDAVSTLLLSAKIYQAQGELDTALERLQQGLSIADKTGNAITISLVLFYLVRVVLAQQNHPQAQEYQTRLEQLQTRTPNPWIHLCSRLAEALVLKQSPRLKEKIRAQTLFEQLVQEEVLWFDMTALAIIQLSELLIAEVKFYGEPDVWEEAKALIDKLYVMAQDQHSFSMSVEALLLRAKAAVVDGKLPQALRYYEQARLTATEKDLTGLLAKVDTEQQRFEADFEKMQSLIQSNASLQERVTSARMEDYLKAIQPLLKPDVPPES